MHLGDVGPQRDDSPASRRRFGKPAGTVLPFGKRQERIQIVPLWRPLAAVGHRVWPSFCRRRLLGRCGDPLKNVRPLTAHGLTEQPQSRVPRRIVAPPQPSPVGDPMQRDQRRRAHGSGQVGNRCIHRHDQVEIRDQGRGVHESARLLIQPMEEIEHRKIDPGYLLGSLSLLQTDEQNTAQARQGGEFGQGNRIFRNNRMTRACRARRSRS